MVGLVEDLPPNSGCNAFPSALLTVQSNPHHLDGLLRIPCHLVNGRYFVVQLSLPASPTTSNTTTENAVASCNLISGSIVTALINAGAIEVGSLKQVALFSRRSGRPLQETLAGRLEQMGGIQQQQEEEGHWLHGEVLVVLRLLGGKGGFGKQLAKKGRSFRALRGRRQTAEGATTGLMRTLDGRRRVAVQQLAGPAAAPAGGRGEGAAGRPVYAPRFGGAVLRSRARGEGGEGVVRGQEDGEGEGEGEGPPPTAEELRRLEQQRLLQLRLAMQQTIRLAVTRGVSLLLQRVQHQHPTDLGAAVEHGAPSVDATTCEETAEVPPAAEGPPTPVT